MSNLSYIFIVITVFVMMNFVSGFIGGANVRADRNIGKYIDLGKRLLDVRLPLVLFLEKSVAELMDSETFSGKYDIRKFNYGGKTFEYIKGWDDKDSLLIVLFEKEDLYFWNYRHLASNFFVETENPKKDSLDYFIVQIQKLEWMRIAIHLFRTLGNPDDAQFAWVDFGIAHVFGESQENRDHFKTMLCEMYSSSDNGIIRKSFADTTSCKGGGRGRGKVRFASCREWKPDNPVVWALDIYTHVKWVIAGGVFLGWPEDIDRLAGIFYERCFRILIEKKTLMWEVNILALLWSERRDLFELYPCNHNSSILEAIGKHIPDDWASL